jgi:hypothetical protein
MQSTMVVVRPDLDAALQQRMDALAHANVIRSRRAQLKRDLKDQRVSIHDVLTDPPEWVGTMKVLDLLLAVPRLGPWHASKILNRTGISATKVVGSISSRTVGGMSERQRSELLAALAPYRGRS